ncbi:MAG: hypothetical protein HQ449_05595 [Chitinophagaceae bacterium]|nr:hypothetical protein [Chitinophagaceae bacterium]
MSENVEAGWETLYSQSKTTAEDYFFFARALLEKEDIKYSAADVIALAQVMAYDLRTTAILVSAQKIKAAIEHWAMVYDRT